MVRVFDPLNTLEARSGLVTPNVVYHMRFYLRVTPWFVVQCSDSSPISPQGVVWTGIAVAKECRQFGETYRATPQAMSALGDFKHGSGSESGMERELL